MAMKIQDLFTAGKLIALVIIIITGFIYLFLGLAGSHSLIIKHEDILLIIPYLHECSQYSFTVILLGTEGPAENLARNAFVEPFDFKGEKVAPSCSKINADS
jgi:hypothetical protein